MVYLDKFIMGWDRTYKYDMTLSNKQLLVFSSENEYEHEWQQLALTSFSDLCLTVGKIFIYI